MTPSAHRQGIKAMKSSHMHECQFKVTYILHTVHHVLSPTFFPKRPHQSPTVFARAQTSLARSNGIMKASRTLNYFHNRPSWSGSRNHMSYAISTHLSCALLHQRTACILLRRMRLFIGRGCNIKVTCQSHQNDMCH